MSSGSSISTRFVCGRHRLATRWPRCAAVAGTGKDRPRAYKGYWNSSSRAWGGMDADRKTGSDATGAVVSTSPACMKDIGRRVTIHAEFNTCRETKLFFFFFLWRMASAPRYCASNEGMESSANLDHLTHVAPRTSGALWRVSAAWRAVSFGWQTH